MANEIYIAKEQTSQDIKSIVGKTNDSGGTTTTGTVVAKENAILTEVNKIGNIVDTGGSATAGTVMGKLNNIISSKKYKSYKRVSNISLPANATNYTLLSVMGAGEFYGALATCSNLTVSIDGGAAMRASGSTSANAFVPYVPSGIGSRSTSSSTGDLSHPMPFKRSLVITANAGSNLTGASISYALYE